MEQTKILTILDRQRDHFSSGATLPVGYRITALKKLYTAVSQNEHRIAQALHQDLGKSPEESFMCETGMVLSEISYQLRHLRRFVRPKQAPTPLAQFPSKSYVMPCPYGTVLIMSPWNYPFLLTLDPLVDAIAAGNTAILKPSAYAPATSALLSELIGQTLPPELAAVVPGGRQENAFLLEQKFDYIFFTGSKEVGRLVLEKAAAHLTPVTLELGGKSPCIVDDTADLALAAKRIVFGKFLNCGQTCVAPDYILCHHSIRDRLLDCLKKEIQSQYPDPLHDPDYGNIITEKHFQRLLSMLDPAKTVCGGQSDPQSRTIAPTVMSDITWDDPVMQEEIFGPVLPVLTFDTTEDVIATVRAHEKPLALYLFSENQQTIHAITTRCLYGGGCVNDCIIHLATSAMGFGGVGESGMGAYHGKDGFDTFTHYKSMVHKKTWLDLPMRYRPYKKAHTRLIRFFLK